MSGFSFSNRSLKHLEGVQPELVAVAKRALELTQVDFGIIDGLRTVEEQREMVARGASKTMKSKHLEGRAVDTMAYVNGKGRWEEALYAKIADAFAQAARELKVRIRWGGDWDIPNIADAAGRPLVVKSWDSGHFELN